MTTFSEIAKPIVSVDSPDGIAVLAGHVLEIRSIFFDHLSSLAIPFNEIIRDHFIARVVRAEDRYMLGEYGPFFLADIFQIPDPLTRKIAIPWLVLYEHSLLVDDIIDVKEHVWPQQLLASQLLFDEVLSLWRDRFAKFPDLWDSFCRYHKEGVSAAFQDLIPNQDLPVSTLGSRDAQLLMGRKAALVKFCGATLSIEHRGRLLSADEDTAIDKLCAGFQLLDDLSDCIEDYGKDRYTYPLRLAVERLQLPFRNPAAPLGLPDDDYVLFVVMVSGAATHVANLAHHYFEEGLASLNVRSDSKTGLYTQSLIDACCRFTDAFGRLRTERIDLIETMLAYLDDRQQTRGTQFRNEPYDRFLVEMRNCFKIIIVAAN